jgi:signal recognition particle subunit SRP54
MFETLTERLQGVFGRLRGHGVLKPEDVDQALREVRIALLEADVALEVVKTFIARVRERAVGEEVLASLTPAQTVIKIVHEEMVALLGDHAVGLRYGDAPSALVLVGLQGGGKTTAAAKLAQFAVRQGRRPLLVAADLTRPAAAEQLRLLGERVGVPVLLPAAGEGARDVAARGREEARRTARDTLIVDTAGRLQIDEALMAEAAAVARAAEAAETLLVVDAMTGQEAVRVAEGFAAHLTLTGLVLTKMDGDARGGAALSLRARTGLPVKFVGMGERADALEVFHPERVASRILGMGDVLTLIERSQATVDADSARQMSEKALKEGLDLEDFLTALRQVRKMGPLDSLLGMLPGMGPLKAARGMEVDEKDMGRLEAIVSSMTPGERRHPEMLDASRRRRVARGSGTQVQDVNRLLRQFEGMQRMVREVGGMSRRLRRSGLGAGSLGPQMPGMPALPTIPGLPAAQPGARDMDGRRDGGDKGRHHKRRKR